MADVLKKTLFAGAAALTLAAGVATIPATADARPFGYGGWHGAYGGWHGGWGRGFGYGRGFYGPRVGFGYGRGFYGPGVRVGFYGPRWGGYYGGYRGPYPYWRVF